MAGGGNALYSPNPVSSDPVEAVMLIVFVLLVIGVVVVWNVRTRSGGGARTCPCAACGALHPPDAHFCRQCGRMLA